MDPHQLIAVELIQRGIILFWAVWYTLVSTSDTIDYLQLFKVIKPNRFNSKNSNLIKEFWMHYDISSPTIIGTTYAVVIAIAYIITILFWYAFILSFFSAKIDFFHAGLWAFFISLAFHAFFMLMDEIFIQYSLEHMHIIRFILQFVMLIAFIYI